METYPLVVFVHVLAATVLVGTSLVFPLTRRVIRSVCTTDELRTWIRFFASSSAANPACALVLLATGAYLGWQGGWWRLAWFQVALALFVVNAVYAARTLARAGAELGAAAGAASAGRLPETLDELRWSPRLDVAADVLLANDLAALFIMIVKPGVAGACGSVAVANAALLAVRRRRRARVRASPVASAPVAAAWELR